MIVVSLLDNDQLAVLPMFKFLHAADIHLDSPLIALSRYEGAPVEACRSATRRALENLVDLAISEKVAFVVIAGDLSDGDWHDYQSILFFGNQMRKLEAHGIKVFLIRGNHDAHNRMNLSLNLPGNTVFLSHDRPQTIELDDFGVAIHGQGYAVRHVKDNLTLKYPKPIPGLFNLAILHTCALSEYESPELYAPCSIDDMKRLGYHYWALGHIHKRATLHQSDPFIAFPGNIQGRHAKETGEKGCLLVTVDDALDIKVESRWLHVMRWEHQTIDLTGAIDTEAILDAVKLSLDRYLKTADDPYFAFRIELNGACPAHEKLASKPSAFLNEIRQTANQAGDGRLWVEKVVVKTRPYRNQSNLETEGPFAEIQQLIGELLNEDQQLERFQKKEFEEIRNKLSDDYFADLDIKGLLPQVVPILLERLHGL